jgi:UDPglucose 6-dehydrogenase
VIVTEWEELMGLVAPALRDAMRTPLIVDGRNLLDPDEARAAGFFYESIGRAAHDLDALPETEEPETKLHQ